MIRFLIGFGQFWYAFIVGDDWKVAVSVVAAMALPLAGLLSGVLGRELATVVGALALVSMFTFSMVIDVRRSAPPAIPDDALAR